MGNPSKAAHDTQEAPAPPLVSILPEDCQLARTARLNLLLIHRDRAIQNLLDLLVRDLPRPVSHWRPGQRLLLPSFGRSGTMVLHDVSALTPDDQLRLLHWLERNAGQTQVVSTTPLPLLPRVQSGRFDETLYYRLNTVCVDISETVQNAKDAKVAKVK